MPKTVIVIGVDFSDASRRALDVGRQLALDLGGRVVLAHAVGHLPGVSLEAVSLGASASSVQSANQQLTTAETTRLSKRWAEPLRTAGLEVDTFVQEGNPDDVILEAAGKHDARFVVVGSHGWRGFKRFVLGSVAQTLLLRTDKPLLVVPAGTD